MPANQASIDERAPPIGEVVDGVWTNEAAIHRVTGWRPSFALIRLDFALPVWAILLTALALHERQPWYLIAVPVAVLSRSRPWVVAAVMIGSAALLRMTVEVVPTDPLDAARLAFERLLAGQNPYETQPAYVYGPLGLLTYQLGIPGELLAAVGIGIILAWKRAWFTLALFSTVPVLLLTPATGANDHSPAFLLLLAWVLLPTHPRIGAGVLASAIAVKPYVAAWALPAIGYGGIGVLLTGAAVSAVLWAPTLLWSSALLEAMRGRMESSGWSFTDLGWPRYLALPVNLAGLWVHSWRGALLVGSASYAVYLGLAPSVNLAHLVPLIAALGLGLESVAQEN